MRRPESRVEERAELVDLVDGLEPIDGRAYLCPSGCAEDAGGKVLELLLDLRLPVDGLVLGELDRTLQ